MARLSLDQRLRSLAPRLAWLATPAGVWGLWAATSALMLANLVFGHHYGDPQFYQYAGDFAVGKLPFRDVPVEYPPLAFVLILLPALPLLPFAGVAPRPVPEALPLTHLLQPDPIRYGAYGVSFGLFMLALDALTLWLVLRFARRFVPGDATGYWSGLLYVALVFGDGAVLQKFDLVPGALCVAAIALLLARRDGWAWAVLALAVLTKGYPILLAPLFVLWRVPAGRPDWRALRRAALGGGIAAALVLAPVIALSGVAPLVHSVAYHADRGVEIESVWASIMLAVGWLPGQGITTTFNPGDLSRDVHAPLQGLALAAWPLALAILALAVYGMQWRRDRQATGQPQRAAELVRASLLLALIFALCFPALGVHYLLGIIPLAVVTRLARPAHDRWLAALIAVLVLSQIVITIWHSLVALDPLPALLMIARNAALVAAAVVLARAAVLPLAIATERGPS